MYDNYNYPMGADNASAPWNEPIIPEKEFDITCCQTLSKTVSVLTSNYIPGACGAECEPDGEGGYCTISYQEPDDTSETDWEEEYHNNDYHTPEQLLLLFKQCLEENLSQGVVFKSPKYTEHLIEECSGWCNDETEITE